MPTPNSTLPIGQTPFRCGPGRYNAHCKMLLSLEGDAVRAAVSYGRRPSRDLYRQLLEAQSRPRVIVGWQGGEPTHGPHFFGSRFSA
jgi:hypothetical protein